MKKRMSSALLVSLISSLLGTASAQQPTLSTQHSGLSTSSLTQHSGTSPRKAGEIVIEQASLTSPETGTLKFDLGTIYVPENRADPKSRLIGVGFARFKSAQPSTAPPTFHLPGGPGSSLVSRLKQTNMGIGRVLKYVALYQRVADVVFIDQRGYSERGEILKHKYRAEGAPLDQPGSLARSTAEFGRAARETVAAYATKGIDLRGYTVKECADDVNDVRKALGYERITPVATSFGSQWSFAIMRRHPQVVARALLSGVEPLDCGYDMPSHVFAAIRRMWWQAEKDPRLQPYLPPGGLMAAAREVLRRLEREPVRIPGKFKDPKTGEPRDIVIGKDDFQRDVLLRGPNGPAMLLALYYERYELWALQIMASRMARDVDMELIGPLIDTSLGVTPKREHQLRTDPATEFLGQWNFDSYLATAEIWPTLDVGDDFRSEIVNSIPIVFAQGDWDTSTPIENTFSITPYFTNSRVIITEHGGHGVLDPIAERLPEVMNLLLEFLRTGNMEKLPSRVTLPAPQFVMPAFPPPSKVR